MRIDDVLDALENLGIAHLIQESTWAYPLLLTIHSIGLAMLAGTSLVIGIRTLGAFGSVPVRGLSSYVPIGIAGFALNALSGALLFTADAHRFYDSGYFLSKLALVFVGAYAGWRLSRLLFVHTEWPDGGPIAPMRLRLLAGLSVGAWLAAIATGRLIAYGS
jgi:hypothetical protein